MGEVGGTRPSSGRRGNCCDCCNSRGGTGKTSRTATGPGAACRSARAYELAKRVLDVLVSAVVLILCLPLCLLIAVAIRLESRGGVLFAQKRAGRNGEPFRMLKFRSMVRDAQVRRERLVKENGTDGPVFKVRNDSRITRVGRVLRRTSLDELPQFLNVLRGDMSLVGPRPLPVSDIGHRGPLPPGISQDVIDEWVAARLTVSPGVTGLWQINGRSLLPLEGWVRYDMEYVEKQSALVDIKILLLTPLVVFTGRGAF